MTTLAGSGASGSADGTGAAAMFNKPTGVAVSTLGIVYVTDNENHLIRVISPTGTNLIESCYCIFTRSLI